MSNDKEKDHVTDLDHDYYVPGSSDQDYSKPASITKDAAGYALAGRRAGMVRELCQSTGRYERGLGQQ